MSAPRKVEITEQTNQNWMDRTIDQLVPYRRAILGLVLTVVVGIVAIALISRQSEQKLARAWDNYFTITEITPANEEAVRKMITELGTTEPGQLLKLKFSQYLLREGTQQLFSDKVAGKKKLDEAKLGFSSIAASSKNSLVIEESLLGAAICEAALGNEDAAIAGYEKQLKQFPQGMYSQVATTNLERINNPEAKEWYDWFEKVNVDVSTPSINPFPDFGRAGGNIPGGNIPGSGIQGSGIPGSGPLPSLDGPGSLMPSLDPLNPLGNSGVPSTTPGLQDFTIPGPAGTEPATKDGATTPEKSEAEKSAPEKSVTEPAAPADGKTDPATTPLTPEKSATPEPAKSEPPAEPAKAEPAKSEPAKDEPTKDTPATTEPEPAAKK